MHLYFLNHKPGLLLTCLDRPCLNTRQLYLRFWFVKSQGSKTRSPFTKKGTKITVSYLKSENELFSQSLRYVDINRKARSARHIKEQNRLIISLSKDPFTQKKVKKQYVVKHSMTLFQEARACRCNCQNVLDKLAHQYRRFVVEQLP